jgi:hypothetical protein
MTAEIVAMVFGKPSTKTVVVITTIGACPARLKCGIFSAFAATMTAAPSRHRHKSEEHFAFESRRSSRDHGRGRRIRCPARLASGDLWAVIAAPPHRALPRAMYHGSFRRGGPDRVARER